ncbi:response regulator [Gemmatimonas sp.]|uniref:PAS domain-containing hybrid sensor histidine kinase/response regulator n=1 Tax=Gemmatimonas sp. TaxID=1962908 RepID=UPI0033410762
MSNIADPSPDGDAISSPPVAPATSEAVLELLQRQLEEAQRLAGIGSWSWDLRTGAVAWSRETYRILGFAYGTPPSFERVLALAVDEARQTEFLDLVHAALRGEREYDFEIPARLADGSQITIHTRGVVERADDGTPLRMLGTMQDVTAMRAAEAALREREAQFRTLAESSPAGVFQTSRDGYAVYANQRVLDWFDMDFEAFASGAWVAHVHPDDMPVVENISTQARDQLLPIDMAYRIVVKDRTRWLRVRSEPFFDSDGVTVLGHIGYVIDTSAERFASEERARLQSQLQQARRLESLGLLAGGVAHDFNNLLVGMLANASLARDELDTSHPAREALDDITHAAQRAADLTRQLLSYAGRARLERRQVPLPSLVLDIPKVLGARIPPHIALTVDAPVGTVVDGDETQLRQVVLNLITNAVDAVGMRNGSVSLTVSEGDYSADTLAQCLLGRERSPGRFAVICVKDTGSGMSHDVQERMFDPFFTTKVSGRGLGLAATLGILNSHGGAIKVDSTEGVGTTICVLLPVSRNRPTPPSVTAVPSSVLNGTGVVLLVDDDVNARSAARRILTRAGYDVREAENGADAIARLDAMETTPRCIVLDLSMPIMSGDECLRTLRARGSTIPVLMSSGYDADDVAAHLLAPGSVHFLQKPYTSTALLQAIHELVGA